MAGRLDTDAYGRAKMAEYRKIKALGEGKFAEVFKYVRSQLRELAVAPWCCCVVVSCRVISLFRTLAVVCWQEHIKTGNVVAVKRLKKVSYSEGISLAAICEIQYLQELSHANVIKVRALSVGHSCLLGGFFCILSDAYAPPPDVRRYSLERPNKLCLGVLYH